jgi:type IV pilus assembly protein PilA
MASTFLRLRREEGAFTLVELLVVMLILGALAAIAVPSFITQEEKATDAGAKQIARSAHTAMETCRIDSSLGGYTGCTAARLRAIEPSLPGNPELKVSSVSLTGYTVIVQSADLSSRTFRIRRNPSGSMTYSCTAKGIGSCPDSGFWN